MEIGTNQNISPVNLPSQPLTKAPEAELNSPAPPEQKDTVHIVKYAQSDLTPDGKVPIIIKAKSSEELESFKKSLPIFKNKPLIKDDLPVINGFTAEVDPKELISLYQKKPEDISIFLNGRVRFPEPVIPEADKASPVISPKLDVAIPTLGVDKVWQQGYTGKGVGIAIIDTGIYPHPDLKNRIVAFKDFINGNTEPYDDQGHGTHVAGDAAGDGTASAGKYKGTAPDANLISIKVLDKHGAGRFSDIIKGIQWAIANKDKYNIRVINMSLGGPVTDSYKDDPVAQTVEQAMKAGIVPVIAAGNSGPKPGTVGTPGFDPNVLTVGALDDKNTVDRSDDEVAKFSSRGPTPVDGLTKPDVLTPGVKITAANAPGSELDKMPQIPHVGENYITISGTSMATPIMSGIVADLIQANPKLTPEQVKAIFKETADKLPAVDANTQGSGVVDPQEAIKKALAG
ncbi:MAG: S8 family peptidase [Firmicutes bacterium]|nr:S8 family peptidase [Bacillota bacterium]